jgi:TM2 domain-containing membrane protein YozV
MKLVSSTVMATPATAKAQAPAAAQSSTLPTLCLIAGWLVPGAGHFILKKPIRGALLFLSVVAMFTIGIALEGKIYQPNTGDLLDILGFVGQLGAGLLYAAARLFDWGHPSVQVALADYGTKFIVVAGLLNIVSAVDAHSLANGRKAS